MTEFLRERVGRRGVSLLFFALLDLVYAASLAAPPAEARASPFLRVAAGLMPLPAWAVLWAVVGLVCLVSAFRVRDRVGFGGAIALKVLWGTVYVVAAFQHVPRAYLGAAIWLCLAAWVAIISTWPEPPNIRPEQRGR